MGGPWPTVLILFFLCVSRKPTHVPVLFRPPSWRPSHFLLLVQEKVTKENTPSRPRSPEKPATAQARCGGLLTVHPCTAANAPASCRRPCGLFPPRACRDREGPGSQSQKQSEAQSPSFRRMPESSFCSRDPL